MNWTKDIFEKGVELLVSEHAALEVDKKGTLRGGSSGVYQGGQFIGKCPRQSYLRKEGIEYEKIDNSKQLMFQAGYANEDKWLEVLDKGLPKGFSYKCEEETPIKWTTTNGTTVTGRPDIVIFDEEDSPHMGLELKLVCSLWTARDVGFQLKPKLDHLIQAAHYSWKLDIPYELWYTNRTNFSVGSGWEQNTFPKPKDLSKEQLGRLSLGTRKDKYKGEVTYIKAVEPFIQGYELRWLDRGQLQFRAISEGSEWQMTPVTQKGIEDYYEYVAYMNPFMPLGEKISTMDCNGDKMSWSLCNYCPLNDVCSQTNKDTKVSDWLEMVKSVIK